jgi:hypothetical protein
MCHLAKHIFDNIRICVFLRFQTILHESLVITRRIIGPQTDKAAPVHACIDKQNPDDVAGEIGTNRQ